MTAGDEEEAAGFFVCDCRKMLDNGQSAGIEVKSMQCILQFLVWLTGDGEKILLVGV